jgi:hypothetical protein
MISGKRPKTFGIIGVIAAFLALLTVLVGPSVHDAIFPKPRLEDRIADTAFKIRDRVAARLKGAPPPEKRIEFRVSSSQFPYSLSLAFVGAAIVGGCVSYLRREDHRYAYVACGVGTLTLAWHAVLLALGALVLCVIIFSVCSFLGIS